MSKNNGYVTEAGKQYYWSFAKGGAGCVYVESPNIDEPLGLKKPGDFRIDDDKYISGLKELVDGIHKHGAKTWLQLYHAGPWHQREFTGLTPVAASPHAEPEFKSHEEYGKCEELSIEKIEIITEKFIAAAERSQKAGFDGVDINCGAAHLLQTFLCRYWNYRHDEYGCDSLENRARFTLNIIKGIKKRCGDDFPVGVLMNGTEYGMGDLGTTRAEAVEFAKRFEAVGADAFHVRSYQYGNMLSIYVEQYFYPEKRDDLPEGMDFRRKGPGAFIPDCYAIKQAVSKPVLTPGKWEWEIEYAEECIEQGKIDAIGITRGLNADPELPKKIKEGRLKDIRPCTACFVCFEGHQFPEPTYTYCRINPFMGKELEYEAYPQAKKKKRVLIAGGGPSGMEAARTAALRGHDVTLYSGDRFLGGLMPMAAVIKGNYPEDIENIIKWYSLQMKKLGVKIVTGKKVAAEIITKIKPHAVVVATGAASRDRALPGWDNKKVVSIDSLCSKLNAALKFSKPVHLNKATKLWIPIGKTVVVMGGDIKGLQLAEFLVKRGRKVTVVEESRTLGEGMNLASLGVLSQWLRKKGVSLLAGVEYREINDKGLMITSVDGQKQTIEAESIVCMTPLIADGNLAEELKGIVPEIHVCGSCNIPGLIRDAINDGNKVGMAL